MGSVFEKVLLVKDESARIGNYLKTLKPKAWATQSACDAWQVADVVAHLTGAVDRFGPNIIRGIEGDSSAPEGSPPAGEGDLAARLRANAQVAIDFKNSLGAELLNTYNDSRLRFDAVFAELKEEDRDKPCYHAAGTISVETYLNLRLTELIVHEWDIRSRLEVAPVMSPESLPSIIEMFPVFVVGRLFDPGSSMPASARFRFELTGPVAGSYDIVAGGGQKALMESASEKRPDAIFGCDSQTFVLLVYGRLSLEKAIADGHIVVTGDTSLIANFGR
ncbi:MAG: maleylpyruvate isomerase family mycothiol-dependent enzyme [Chloroflexi bacterium]|nr:maleylpyruvate isomerase family mycothiol-dependent enzyme [Chloroflexota bacterium]